MCRKVFISYATPDHDIAEELIKFFQSVDGLKLNEIYYAAKKEGQIPSGTYFCEHILNNLKETQYTIILLSKHYEISFNCAMELGASFCAKEKDKHIILTIPPYEVKDVPTLLQGIQIEGDITEKNTLMNLNERLIQAVTGKSAPTTTWSTMAKESAESLKEIARDIPAPSIIKKADYDKLNEKLAETENKFKNQDQQIKKLNTQIVELKQIKDQEKVREIVAKYDDCKSQFDKKTQEIRKKLQGLSLYVRNRIFYFFSGVNAAAGQDEQNEFLDAVSNGYIDEEGTIIESHRRISKILDALRNLRSFLDDNENADFIQDICNDEECEPCLSDKTFWDALFG